MRDEGERCRAEADCGCVVRVCVCVCVQRFEAEPSAVAKFETGWAQRTSNLTTYTLDAPDLYDMFGDGLANDYANLAYDGVYSLVYAMRDAVLAGGDPRNGTLVMEFMRQTDFQGSTGRVRFSDIQQERVAPFDVMNPYAESGMGEITRRIAAYYPGIGLDFSKFPTNDVRFGDGTAFFDDGSNLSARATTASGGGISIVLLNTPTFIYLQVRVGVRVCVCAGRPSTQGARSALFWLLTRVFFRGANTHPAARQLRRASGERRLLGVAGVGGGRHHVRLDTHCHLQLHFDGDVRDARAAGA